MSRRFGRQQKRKMRAQIADMETRISNLQEALAMQQGLSRNMSSRLDEMRGTFNVLERVLGPYFIGLPPKQVEVREIYDVYQIPGLFSPSPKMWDTDDQIELEHKVYSLETTMLNAEYRKLRGCMHVRLSGPAGRFAYSTTREALYMVPKDDLIRRLSQEFAMAMVNDPSFDKAYRMARP